MGKKRKFTAQEKKLIEQVIKEKGSLKFGTNKSENLGWTDLPMFNQNKQEKLKL